MLAWNAGAARTLQLFMLRRERGGLDDYLPEVTDHEDAFPSPLVHRSVLAHVYARLGRAEEAAALVREITRHDLSDWHVDEQWLVSVCLLAETCAIVDDLAPAASCTTSCCATAGRTRSPSPSWRWTPPAARSASWRPRSAASRTRSGTSGRRRAMNERMGARPWVAHTQLEHARMLLRRDGEGDREQAAELLARRAATYRELGMDDDLVRVEELRVQASAGSNSERLTKRPWPGCETTLPPS